MIVSVINESGYRAALFGLGLSFGITSNLSYGEFTEDSAEFKKMAKVAVNLAHKDGGHNKVIESVQVWMDIDAPRYWWSEADTYRAGVTKNSESTMHTLAKGCLTQQDFERPIDESVLSYLNELVTSKADIETLKEHLPEGFKQRRIVCTNYKALRNMILQRKGHRLTQWQTFTDAVISQLEHPKLLGKDVFA